MNEGISSDVIIRLGSRRGSYLLTFERAFDREVLEVSLRRPKARLQALKKRLPVLLDSVRRCIGMTQLTLTDPQIIRAANHLDRLAFGMLDLVLDDSGARAGEVMPRIQEFLAPVFESASPESPAPIVELEASAEDPLASLFPFEFLPVVSLPRQRLFERDRFESFLGFRAEIVRFLRAGPTEIQKNDSGRVPVHLFSHDGTDLPGVGRQSAYLDEATAVTSKWPRTNAIEDEFSGVSDLANALISLPPISTQQAIQCIAHFCCHYHAAGPDGEGYYWPKSGFDFGQCTDGSALAIDLLDLRGELERLQAGKPRAQFAALFFLNACQTAAAGDTEDNLFAFFRGRHATALVGSESLLPDGLAAEFAISFYKEVLRHTPIGAALLKARRFLLDRHSNPVGLFYTFLGSPLLRVAP